MDILIATHGVGNASDEKILSDLQGVLETGGAGPRVHTYHWADLSPGPDEQDPLSVWFPLEVLSTSVAASCVDVWSATWGDLLRPARASVLLAEAARLLIMLPLLLLIAVLPAAAIVDIVTYWTGASTAFVVLWCWAVTLHALALGIFAAAAALCIDLATAILTANPHHVIAGVRRNILYLLGPAFALSLVVFQIPWRRRKASWICASLVLGILVVVIAGLFKALESWFHVPGENRYEPVTWSGAAYFTVFVALAVVGFAGATLSVALAAVLVVPSLVKVSLDVLSYVGDPIHRAKVLGRFDDVVKEKMVAVEPGETLFIAGHSLGSVISLDYLLNHSAGQLRHNTVLITAGSPIRRLFANFFPNYLFPTGQAASASLLGQKLRGFRWVNVYRPLDPVGGSLGLNRRGAGIDACTWQWQKGHTGYWSDPLVVDKVSGALCHAPHPTIYAANTASYFVPACPHANLASEEITSTTDPAEPAPHKATDEEFKDDDRGGGGPFRWVLAAAAIVGAGASLYTLEEEYRLHRLLPGSRGTAVADVGHRRHVQTTGSGATQSSVAIHEFKVDFVTKDGRRIHETLELADYPLGIIGFGRGRFVDRHSLIEEVRAEGTLENLPRPLLARNHVWSQGAKVEVEYLPEKPTYYEFPSHRREPSTLLSLADGSIRVVLGGLFGVMAVIFACLASILALAAPLYMLLPCRAVIGFSAGSVDIQSSPSASV